eukprot:jgi/Mesvir1/14186/Mv09643-RA.1
MGGPKRASKHGRVARRPATLARAARPTNPQDVEAHVQAICRDAETKVDMGEYEAALADLHSAHSRYPDNVTAMDAYGALLAETGSTADAVAVLRRSVEKSPDVGHEKYMYLGQLVEDPRESLSFMQKGAEVLERAVMRAQQEGDPALPVLASSLASALCSLAENYLSKLSQEAENLPAEQQQAVYAEVERLLGRAKVFDPASPEPLQVMASLRLEQDKPEEAKEQLMASLALWPPEELAGSVMDVDNAHELPPFEFRVETAKLLLEVAELPRAVSVLQRLVEENDTVHEVWYLLGVCHFNLNEKSKCLECCEQGLAVSARHAPLHVVCVGACLDMRWCAFAHLWMP